MLDVLSVVFWGLVLLTVIVFIHEVGHYLAARALGMRVKEFMIGLPGPKVFFKRKDTRYGVTAIPLGGYCLIAGMEKGDDGPELEQALSFIAYFGRTSEAEADKASESSGVDLASGLDTLADWGTVRRYKKQGLYHYVISAATIEGTSYDEGQVRKIDDIKGFLAAEKKLTYSSAPWWKRIVMLLGGSVSNLIVAMATLIIVLMIVGSLVYTNVIDTVTEDSPAQAAGLMPGDELVALGDVSISDWEGFGNAVQQHQPGDKVKLSYIRDGEEKVATITMADREGNAFVGVSPQVGRGSVSFLQAAEFSVTYIVSTFGVILQLINPATFSETVEQTSSVIGISILASNAASVGPSTFILLIGFLSVSIGLINLLPIPPLDGGKIIIETIERITKKRIPANVINGISLIGLAAILLLFVVATNADIHRFFLNG